MLQRSKSFVPRGTIAVSEKQQKRIYLNVGGEKHSPYVSTLKNIPDSPLAWIVRNECKGELDYDPITGVYFFDRHPGIFSQVLNYFQTGKLHCPRDVCGPMFQKELNFWGIDETQMEACCWPNYTEHREIQENLKLFHIRKVDFDPTDNYHNDQCNKLHEHTKISSRLSKWKRYQSIIWEVLDEPYSSNIATAFSYISLGCIVLSIITYTLMTMDIIREKKECEQLSEFRNASVHYHCNSTGLKTIRGFEVLFTIWFTFEIILRFTFCPNKIDFMKTRANWVDLLAVVPVYLFIFYDIESSIVMILNMVRYVRIFRFFKLLYDLHILGKTLQASTNQLLILVLILCVPAVIFSSIVYFAETHLGTKKSKEDFKNIPYTIWWAVVTMSTVGYGRISPESWLGRLFGSAAAVIGILIVSMTTSVIGSSFQQYYQVARTQLKIPAKKQNVVKIQNGNSTLVSKIHRDDKTASIQSDDSKDSGYGRSPIPPAMESENNTSPPVTKRERNIIISINKDEDGRRRKSSVGELI